MGILSEGIFEKNIKGFGFIRPDIPGESIFVAEYDAAGLMHGDRVRYSVYADEYDFKGRKRAEIDEVLEGGAKDVAGVFHKRKRNSYVAPLDKRYGSEIRVLAKYQKKAQDGQLVMAQVKRPFNPFFLEGRIIEILGDPGGLAANELALIRQSGVPAAFPPDVLAEAKKAATAVPPGEASARARIGFTVVTIDGEDTKDVDDAIHLDISALGEYILGVHIADVCHYVKEGSALDNEALRRGTSVYLEDRVLPMLPVELSNGICSLNEGVDRLALTCVMKIGPSGEILGHDILESVLTVSKHMTYPKVTAALSGEEVPGYMEYLPMLKNMERLCGVLRRRREERGAVSFDLEESKAELDENGRPIGIHVRERGIASEIIEEFMLACNETVAQEFAEKGLPFVYRIHEPPASDKLRSLKMFAASLGHKMPKDAKKIKSGDLQKLMEGAKGKPEEGVLTRTVLRSMKRARYFHKNQGHYGLAAEYYCHFTSPIRRYPDLQIHRIIKESLRGMAGGRAEELGGKTRDVSKSASLTERRAEELERNVLQLMKCEFMKDKLGQEFTGVISGVTSWGIFVELPNTVEGMASVRDMGDRFVYNEARMSLTGERTGQAYALGGTVGVVLARVDLETRQIDFIIKRAPKAAKKIEKKGKKRKKRRHSYDELSPSINPEG